MTKPESEGQQAKPFRKRRQAFGEAKDRATKAKFEQKESLLSTLPVEVRRLIWRYVLGDTVLHLHRFAFDSEDNRIEFRGLAICEKKVLEDEEKQDLVAHPWKVVDCCSERSLPQLYEISKTHTRNPLPADIQQWSNEPYLTEAVLRDERIRWFCHRECVRSMLEPRGRTNQQWCNNLALLQTCRMIYHEANHVLWTTNTFSFDDPKSFSAFMDRRTTIQTQLLTKLHLSFRAFLGWRSSQWGSSEWSSRQHWQKSLSLTVIKKLKHLKALHIYMEEGILEGDPVNHPYCRVYQNPEELIKTIKSLATDFLLNFRISPLAAATVIIIPYADIDQVPLLSPTQYLEWTEELRSKLLDPNAVANLEADLEVEKALKAIKSAEAAKEREKEKEKEKEERAKKVCFGNKTAEECRKLRQARQDEKDVKAGRVRDGSFVVEHCGRSHRSERKYRGERQHKGGRQNKDE